MPVTKTAKRALRASHRKAIVNKKIISKLEIAVRYAKKTKKSEAIRKAFSLADRATKKDVIHKRKASRIKSSLSKFLPKTANSKKTSKKKK